MYFARFAPHRGPGAKSVRREALARTSARDLQGKAISPYLAKTSLGQCKGGQTAAHRGCDNAKPRINRIGPRGPSQSGRGARPQSGHSPPPKIAPGPPGLGIKPAESACQGLYIWVCMGWPHRSACSQEVVVMQYPVAPSAASWRRAHKRPQRAHAAGARSRPRALHTPLTCHTGPHNVSRRAA